MAPVKERDARLMRMALMLAEDAAGLGESPVAALVVAADGAIISRATNRMETDRDPTAHAEMLALRAAGRRAGDWRLREATVYVTLEPCIMCAGALLHARVKRVVYAARDERWGAFGSLLDLAHDPRINHEIEVVRGILEEESAELLRRFFRGVRTRLKKK
ncbi:MAG: tRNA adenosine(34) deaminase TadA [Pseudomonadota bacterium]